MDREKQNFWNTFSYFTQNYDLLAYKLFAGSVTFSIFYLGAPSQWKII